MPPRMLSTTCSTSQVWWPTSTAGTTWSDVTTALDKWGNTWRARKPAPQIVEPVRELTAVERLDARIEKVCERARML
jgi:hypothetical protein